LNGNLDQKVAALKANMDLELAEVDQETLDTPLIYWTFELSNCLTLLTDSVFNNTNSKV